VGGGGGMWGRWRHVGEVEGKKRDKRSVKASAKIVYKKR